MEQKVKELLRVYNVPEHVIKLLNEGHKMELNAVKEVMQQTIQENEQEQKQKNGEREALEQFKKMSLTDKGKLFKEDPETYKKLSEQAKND